MTSIRHRLLVWLLAGVAAAGAAGAVSIYRVARAEANALFDYQLRQTALSFRNHALTSGLVGPGDDTDDALDVRVQIWTHDGLRLYPSQPRIAMPERAQLRFADVATPDGGWRVYSAQLGDFVVQAAQPQSVRHQLAAAMALRTVWPLAAILPLLGLLIWVTVGRGLAPLERIAGEVRGRSSTALEPLPERSLPAEVRPLVHALNDLLGRLAQALDAQRAFVADAAHELRTPLTALRLQARLAERAANETERREALARLKEGVERGSRLVEQLLALAREEHSRPGAAGRARLDEVARAVVVEQASIAQAKGVDLGLAHTEPAAARGDPQALRALATHLVDNAVKYTPASGSVDVAVYRDGADAVLEVTDTGPGIPAAERARVFDRFYRRPGRGPEGSGLGLAIVKRIVERHAGSIALDEHGPRGGLRVTVRLPAA